MYFMKREGKRFGAK
ncbi:unnamed protein product, partial [Vitis vinifera]|uniref:Uncharacterized protein n=1 Tax=Vitis vinifera TaxID=29760 RepID=E0CVV5_VITVI